LAKGRQFYVTVGQLQCGTLELEGHPLGPIFGNAAVYYKCAIRWEGDYILKPLLGHVYYLHGKQQNCYEETLQIQIQRSCWMKETPAAIDHTVCIIG
jgi:hypothetical protein